MAETDPFTSYAAHLERAEQLLAKAEDLPSSAADRKTVAIAAAHAHATLALAYAMAPPPLRFILGPDATGGRS